MSNRNQNRNISTASSAQQRAYARVDRMLAKTRRRAKAHQQERAALKAGKPRKRFQDRILLIGVIAGIMSDRVIALGGYCKQAVEQVDPLIFANAFLSFLS
ncbi:hypothetical protein [Kordiimonas pumila]|uniref:Uncharacterized protein n=1 Tax=Kordiimonas pumila TaxID=2161677 RepID=A0ABV7D3V3_9PROT|nr:hypothetical protein [Kordiimonas pumila]